MPTPPLISDLLAGVDRRHFFELSGLASVAAITGTAPQAATARRARFTSYPFKLGVTSGDPLPDGVVLWTRLAPEPLEGGGMPTAAVDVHWQVAEDPGFRRVVKRGTEKARPELAHSVHVEVGGLLPAREYYYRFQAGREISPVGRTRTAPPASAEPAAFRFVFASCQQYEHGYFTAYRHIADEDIDLIVHLGDYIYEYPPGEYEAVSGMVRRHHGGKPMNLAEFRVRHGQYNTDKDLKAARAHAPWLVTWDDHEVENNYAGDHCESGQSASAFLRRRAAAYQAYYEHMPVRKSSVPHGPYMRVYRGLRYGRLVDFSVLDTRQYRDRQAMDDRFPQPPSADRDRKSRTMTGEKQEKWLIDRLASSTARWNVIANQTQFSKLDLNPGKGEGYGADSWNGYPANRQRIIDALAEHNVANPVVITGDAHVSYASDIKKNFEDPDSRTLGVEFLGTSISSDGDGADKARDSDAILKDNPHIKFFSDFRGYVRCSVDASGFQADYRLLPKVSERHAPVYTRASWRTVAGHPELFHVGGQHIPKSETNEKVADQYWIVKPEKRK